MRTASPIGPQTTSKRARARIWAWSALACCGPALATDAPVTVCFDEADHTPFLFKDAQGQWRGAALELTRAALDRAGLSVVWLPMPWLRCLNELAQPGGAKPIDAALYGSLGAERERLYLASLPLHKIHGGVWYSIKHQPNLKLQSIQDLSGFRLCGMHGHNYSWLKSVAPKQLDTGALTLKAALHKLRLNRCDLLISSKEQVEGADRMGLLERSPDLRFAPFPHRQPVLHHLLFSKRSARADDLKASVDRGLKALHDSGAANRLYGQYLPSGTGLATGADRLMGRLP